uniref:receptor-like protein 12 n=1 Tax=Fragaria vesca subsp. vesca TaxID=101020 RepID=UPI0005C8CDED|nr:PREDICTED: receptor-like protein 12 [Fragaria vesca subsp. vesca]
MNRNEFNGVIKTLHFPELLILDLSHSSFRGEFPSEYILSGSVMRGITQSQPTYMDTSSGLNIPGAPLFGYDFSMTITNKGVVRYYQKILEDLGFLDISSNKFAGYIPEYIGNLKGLQFLNISHNIFSGSIPSSLGNLIVLESLDMSQNKLSGEIPQKLTLLTSLAYFNVSHNNLTGSIPIGRQFQTFESTSYKENSGLCGDPLPKKCGNSNAPSQLPPSSVEENDSGSEVELGWIYMLAGFGSGLVVGVVLVNEGIKWKQKLFLEIVGMLIRLLKRIRRRRRN